MNEIDRYTLEKQEGWRNWVESIPSVPVKDGWTIKVIPPFGGAMARFLVGTENNPDVRTSIYLDTSDRLGCYGEPYWEVYPYNGDVFRCDMGDTHSLVDAIQSSLDEQEVHCESDNRGVVEK